MKNRIAQSLKYAGLAGVPVYIGFTLAAHLHNPSMGPFKNWLSDYGSPLINPSGALLYNLGCVITAVLLAAFYIGLTSWHDGAPRKLVVCYTGAQASGLISAVFLVLASIVPIGTNPAHDVFSTINMIGMDSFLVFIAIAAFMNPYVSSGLGVLGFIAAAFNIFTANVVGNFFIAEWIFFAMFIVYIALVTVMYERFRGANIRAAQENDASLAQ